MEWKGTNCLCDCFHASLAALREPSARASAKARARAGRGPETGTGTKEEPIFCHSATLEAPSEAETPTGSHQKVSSRLELSSVSFSLGRMQTRAQTESGRRSADAPGRPSKLASQPASQLRRPPVVSSAGRQCSKFEWLQCIWCGCVINPQQDLLSFFSPFILAPLAPASVFGQPPVRDKFEPPPAARSLASQPAATRAAKTARKSPVALVQSSHSLGSPLAC